MLSSQGKWFVEVNDERVASDDLAEVIDFIAYTYRQSMRAAEEYQLDKTNVLASARWRLHQLETQVILELRKLIQEKDNA